MAVDGCGICYVNMWNGYEWMKLRFCGDGVIRCSTYIIIITFRLQPPTWIAHVSESMDGWG